MAYGLKHTPTSEGAYKLKPNFDSRKDFYGKAVVENEDGAKVLYSYNTKVAEIKDGKATVYGLYSVTTTRHIKDFLLQEGFKVENSKQIMKDYGENKSNIETLNIESTFVPRGSGNNPDGGKRDLHYKIKEWGYIFSTKKEALKYAKTHIANRNKEIIEKKNPELRRWE